MLVVWCTVHSTQSASFRARPDMTRRPRSKVEVVQLTHEEKDVLILALWEPWGAPSRRHVAQLSRRQPGKVSMAS
jgi:hypothetical protein